MNLNTQTDDVVLTFALNRQQKDLAKVGLSLADLKAAGFRFRFIDAHNRDLGGQWTAPHSDDALAVLTLLGRI